MVKVGSGKQTDKHDRHALRPCHGMCDKECMQAATIVGKVTLPSYLVKEVQHFDWKTCISCSIKGGGGKGRSSRTHLSRPSQIIQERYRIFYCELYGDRKLPCFGNYENISNSIPTHRNILWALIRVTGCAGVNWKVKTVKVNCRDEKCIVKLLAPVWWSKPICFGYNIQLSLWASEMFFLLMAWNPLAVSSTSLAKPNRTKLHCLSAIPAQR